MKNTFKIGDMVIMTREPTDDEWRCVGEVDIPKEYFNTAHKVTRLSQKANAIILDNGYAYPSCCFELVSASYRDIRAKVGDHIQVINTVGSLWLSVGQIYVVADIDLANGKIKLNGYWWSCQNSDYVIVRSAADESTPNYNTADVEVLLKQQKRITKENALQRAAQEYPAGTTFRSMQTGDVYTVADKPGYEWSENTQGIYLWGINTSGTDLSVYISKRDDWAEIIDRIMPKHDLDTTIDKYKRQVQTDVLLKEAREKFPPGTRFTNVYGSTSVISDDPQYKNDGYYVYAKCVSGKHVTICVAGEWRNIISRPSDRPDIGLSNYEPQPHFDVGDVVEVIEKNPFFNVGHVSTVERADGTTVLMANHTGDSWFINNTKVKHHTVPTRKITLDLPTLSKEELTGLQEYFYPQTKTNTNGTESKQSVKLQGINLQIREGNSIRGIGLKSSGSKIKLGSNNSYN